MGLTILMFTSNEWNRSTPQKCVTEVGLFSLPLIIYIHILKCYTCNMAKKTPLWRRIIHTTGLRIENKHVIHVFRYVNWWKGKMIFPKCSLNSYNSRTLTDYFEFFNLHFITFQFMIKHKQRIIKLFSYSITPRTNI